MLLLCQDGFSLLTNVGVFVVGKNLQHVFKSSKGSQELTEMLIWRAFKLQFQGLPMLILSEGCNFLDEVSTRHIFTNNKDNGVAFVGRNVGD